MTYSRPLGLLDTSASAPVIFQCKLRQHGRPRGHYILTYLGHTSPELLLDWLSTHCSPEECVDIDVEIHPLLRCANVTTGCSFRTGRKRMALGQSIAVWKNTVCDVVLRRKKLPPSQDGRRLKLSPRDETLTDPRRGAPYVQNDIRSSRYTVYDFFPKQLLFQATRLSNFYFILIGIPQAIPGFSTTGNYTTILPLIFFMLLTMAKEGYDDFRRHRMDHQENTSTTKALKETRGNSRDQSDPILEPSALSSQEKSNASQSTQERSSVVARDEKSDTDGNYQWTETQWRYIKVGAIIKIARNEAFPADVCLSCLSALFLFPRG